MTSLNKLTLFAGVLAAEFAIFETGLRLAGASEAAPEFRQLFMDDARIGYRLRPGATAHFTGPEFAADIAINQAGVRDQAIGPKPPGEKRIVVLGDSLVLSVQVALEQTFGERLEARLNARAAPGTTFRVINAGVQGYGPVEEWLFYDEVARGFAPDLVLVGVFVGNDAIEAADSEPKLTGTPDRTAAARAEAAQGLRRITRRSLVLQRLRLRVRTLFDRAGRGEDVAGPLTTYLPEPGDQVTRGLAVSRDAIGRIADRAARDGARTAVVLLPARFQTDDADFGRLKEILAAGGKTLVRDAATERFRAALAPLGLPMFDALEPLKAAPRRHELFFQQTVHLTPRGHDVLAAALQDFLLESGLLGR